MNIGFFPYGLTKTGPPVKRFDTQRDGTYLSASVRIDHKGSAPLCASTAELTIQKVGTFPTDEQLRPDGDRCYHRESKILTTTFLRKTET